MQTYSGVAEALSKQACLIMCLSGGILYLFITQNGSYRPGLHCSEVAASYEVDRSEEQVRAIPVTLCVLEMKHELVRRLGKRNCKRHIYFPIYFLCNFISNQFCCLHLSVLEWRITTHP